MAEEAKYDDQLKGKVAKDKHAMKERIIERFGQIDQIQNRSKPTDKLNADPMTSDTGFKLQS